MDEIFQLWVKGVVRVGWAHLEGENDCRVEVAEFFLAKEPVSRQLFDLLRLQGVTRRRRRDNPLLRPRVLKRGGSIRAKERKIIQSSRNAPAPEAHRLAV